MKALSAKDLFLMVPTAAIAGAALAAIQPGSFWRGWLAVSIVLFIGLAGMVAAWRWAGGEKVLAWMMMLALILRLGAGVAAYIVLPIDGYSEPDDRAGFIFTDAHRRDDQAWALHISGRPLWWAFSKAYYSDQYGGLLALSALAYRVVSPDAHRPLVVLAIAALTAAIGVPFFYRASRLLWDARIAGLAAWLFVLYPESVITGGAQMREPFLLTFIAMVWFGIAQRVQGGNLKDGVWSALGLAGLLLVSPAIAIVSLVLFLVWWRARGGKIRSHWPVISGALLVLVVGLAFLAWSIASLDPRASSIIGMAGTSLKDSLSWVIHQLERGSGQVQNVFSKVGPDGQFAFVVGYGITQPVLPPAILEPTTTSWRIIAVLRAVGWYTVLPLLLYAPLAVRRLRPGGDRREWSWLVVFSWAWILVCAIRAGGDQWDNPRYRLIFFGVQAAVAAFAWLSWRVRMDAWLPRIAAAEILCLLVFGQWYLARYYLIGTHLPIMVVLGICLTGVLGILGGGALRDALARRH